MSSLISRVRLFPLLFVFALAALTVRGVSIYSGYDILSASAPVIAQEAQNTEESNENPGEEAPAQVAAARTAPPVIGLRTKEEEALIMQLRQRREYLEQREQKLELQEQLLASTEKRINDKIIRLQDLEVRIKQHLRLFEEAEEKQLKAIVEVYEKMKPKDAAPRFEALALQTQVDLVTKMKPAKVAALMENMTPRNASKLTTELATQAQPPKIDEVQGGGR